MKKTLYDWCKENNKDYLLKEWDYEKNNAIGLFVDKISYGSRRIANWTCKNYHSYKKRIDARTSNNSQCPYCESRKLSLLEGVNDFATLYPEFLKEWNYEKNTLDPKKILKRSSLKVWWKCKKCGHEWLASLGDRTRTDKPSGCPQCRINNASLAKHLKALSRGSIAKTHPEILKEWDYEKNNIQPTEISQGSPRKVWWKCEKCGYEWQSSPNNRLRKNSKCPNCRYK